MTPLSTKVERVREQVIAKIHWGARDEEVLEWLAEQHHIPETEAEHLLAIAHAAKRKAVRFKALLKLMFAGIGVVAAFLFFGMQFSGRFIVIGYGAFLVGLLGVTSLAVFFRSLAHLTTGRVNGSVD